MYRCHDCGETFEEPRLIELSDASEFWGAPVVETRYEEHCPSCGSDWVEEVQRCQICGEGTEDYLHNFCPDCIADFGKCLTQAKFRIIGEEIKDSDDFEELIIEHFEGEGLRTYSAEVHMTLQKELEQLQSMFRIDYNQLQIIVNEFYGW